MSKKQARPYVKSVHSNLKSPKPNGDAWSVDLGRYTLLVGTNTSHKSSVIQSVELAVSGSVDDVVGRNDVKDADLLLSLCRGDELHTSARFSDDEAGILRTSAPRIQVQVRTYLRTAPSRPRCQAQLPPGVRLSSAGLAVASPRKTSTRAFHLTYTGSLLTCGITSART